MAAAVMYLFCFFQMPTGKGPVPDPHWRDRWVLEQLSEARDSTAAAEAAGKEAAYEEQQFVNKFNHLAQTMMDFASHYNSRHTVDVKGMEKLKNAWRDLEKSDAWFRTEDNRRDRRPSSADRTSKRR